MSNIILPHDHGQSIEKELEQMPSPDDFQVVADIFRLLGDRTGSASSGFCATVRNACSISPPWWE